MLNRKEINMNKMFKVVLSSLMAVMMIIPMAVPAVTALEASGELFHVREFVAEYDRAAAEGTSWSFSETDTEATLIFCYSSDEEVTIPSIFRGKPVTSIAGGAFDGLDGLSNLKTVNIAAVVQKIETNAFKNCAQLSSVNFLPFEGVTGDDAVPDINEICGDAFFNCASLKSISVPKGVVIIGERAFGFTYSEGTYQRISGFNIFGYSNTAANKYANDHVFAFSNLYGAELVTPVQTFAVSHGQSTLNVGEFVRLTPVFGATAPTNTFVRWFSSDKSIAVVDKSGKVTGVSGGEATITAISSDNLKTATCSITVNGPSTGTKVTAVSFTEKLAADTITAYYSTNSTIKYRITYSTTPADAPYDAVAFTYDAAYFDIEYDTSAKCYYMTPKKLTSGSDTVQLKIYSVAYPSVYDTVNVKINDNITGVKWFSFTGNDGVPFDVTSLSAFKWKESEGRLDIVVKLLPSNATASKSDIILTSSNENVAYWNSNNQLVPLRDGETYLTVTTVNGGYTDTIKATLSGTGLYAVMGLKLDLADTQELTFSKSYKLKEYLEFNPENPTNKKVVWASSDSGIISVTQEGVVTCHKRGTAVITVTSVENENAAASVTFTVKLTWWQQILYFFLRIFGISV